AGGTVTEGERSVTEVRVDPQLSGEDSFVVSVLIDDGENDFIAGSPLTTLVTITSERRGHSFFIDTVDDNTDELDGDVLVSLVAPGPDAGFRLGMPRSGTLTVLDNDEPSSDSPVLSVADQSVDERLDAVLPVVLSRASLETVAVSFNVTERAENIVGVTNARSPADFNAFSGRLTFAPGITTQTINVQIVNDDIDEPNEVFVVNLLSAVNALRAPSATITILDDDDATADAPGLAIRHASVSGHPEFSQAENLIPGGASTTAMIFFASLDAPWPVDADNQPLPVSFSVQFKSGTAIASNDPAADRDADSYDHDILVATPFGTAVPRTFNFDTDRHDMGLPPAPIEIVVQIDNDTVDERNETFILELSDPVGITIETPSITATIIDDDPSPPGVPTVSVADAFAREDASPLRFIITLDKPATFETSLDYTTSTVAMTGGVSPAAEPEDFSHTSGTLTFAPGQTSATVEVVLQDDTQMEMGETFLLQLSNPARLLIAAGSESATGTIVDNDVPLLSIVADQTSITEGNEGDIINATFTISSDPPPPMRLDLMVTISQSGDVLVPGAPTVLTPGLAAAQAATTITVGIASDSLDERDGIIFATLADGGANFNVVPDKTTAAVPVLDDDAVPAGAPELVITSPFEFTEGEVRADVMIGLTAPFSREVTVDYRIMDGTATPGADYTVANTAGILRFAPERSEVTQNIPLQIIDDTVGEVTETLFIVFSNPVNAIFPGSQMPVTLTVNILDNDAPVVSIVADQTMVTEGDAATFTVTTTRALPMEYTVGMSYELNPRDSDYGLMADNTLEIPANASSVTYSVTTDDDTVDDLDGVLVVQVLPDTNADPTYVLHPERRQATVPLVDDDNLLEVSPLTLAEDVTEATVTLTSAPDASRLDDDGDFTILYRFEIADNDTATAADIDLNTVGALVFPGGAAGATRDVAVLIVDDAEYEGPVGETFTIRFFVLNQNPFQSIQMTIADNEAEPAVLSVTGGAAVTEGEGALFTITASPTRSHELTVAVQVSEEGGLFLTATPPTMVTLAA
ncbi:MAG: Calx-beta domain-containing protein, partial [Pseudohongiellaceae bacterium]